MDIEKKVIEDIIAMLDEQEGEKLKKHPKLMAMEVEVKKEPMMGKPEMPEESEDESESELELSPEILKKLLEMGGE